MAGTPENSGSKRPITTIAREAESFFAGVPSHRPLLPNEVIKIISKAREQIGTSCNYSDVLAAAIALSPSGKFDSSVGAWSKVLAELQREFEGTNNALLLDNVYVNPNDPWDPQSEEVEKFFSVMRRSGALQFPSTIGSGEYVIDQDSRESILEGAKPLIDQYPDGIARISQLITERLSIPPKSTPSG